ncbi:MAG TPA: hypothetical protein VMT20_24165 [Terriglobia bacterium]|nr:hypothetical protein [Terriglobia bacterium]
MIVFQFRVADGTARSRQGFHHPAAGRRHLTKMPERSVYDRLSLRWVKAAISWSREPAGEPTVA